VCVSFPFPRRVQLLLLVATAEEGEGVEKGSGSVKVLRESCGERAEGGYGKSGNGCVRHNPGACLVTVPL